MKKTIQDRFSKFYKKFLKLQGNDQAVVLLLISLVLAILIWLALTLARLPLFIFTINPFNPIVGALVAITFIGIYLPKLLRGEAIQRPARIFAYLLSGISVWLLLAVLVGIGQSCSESAVVQENCIESYTFLFFFLVASPVSQLFLITLGIIGIGTLLAGNRWGRVLRAKAKVATDKPPLSQKLYCF